MSDRHEILAAKSRLPMTALLDQLAPDWKKKNPIRSDDRTNSFGADDKGWKDHGTGDKGDQITFLEKYESWGRGDAVRRFLEMAGVEAAAQNGQAMRSGPSRIITPQTPFEAAYPYHSANGDHVYDVRRYSDPKDFRPYNPATGKLSLKGVSRVPYRLGDVCKSQAVWIVEGEKDVDNLRNLGFCATCRAGGSSTWEQELTPWFANKDVILCGDNDAPGDKYMILVESILKPVATSVKRVTVPGPSKDISDYLRGMSYSEASAAVEALLNAAQTISLAYMETTAEPPENYQPNDSGNAKRFIDHVGEKLLYVPERESWFVWDRHHWRLDDDGALYRMAEHYATELLRKSADIVDIDVRARQAKLALNLGKRSVIENMLALARYHEAVILHAERLDSNPWLLGVGNGVVDLKSGTFRGGTPSDFISNRAGCDYVHDATCPKFDAFLSRIMAEDAEMVGYLWRIIGYCLTGSTTEQCLFFFFGSGRNGKTTLIEVLSALLGEYGCATAVELITDSRHGREPSQLIAAVKGKRLVWLPEVEENHRVAQSRLKTLTGGDRLSGRYLYEREFEFDCTAKLLIHGNTRPEIRGTDLGIWRRFRLVPFSVTIPVDQVDSDLPSKLIAELPGILNRSINACLDWQHNRMQTPKAVESATDEYREAEDIIGEFLEERTVQSATVEIAKGELHKAFVLWCEDRSQRPQSAKRFGSLIAQRGFREYRTNSAKFWLGIALKGK